MGVCCFSRTHARGKCELSPKQKYSLRMRVHSHQIISRQNQLSSQLVGWVVFKDQAVGYSECAELELTVS